MNNYVVVIPGRQKANISSKSRFSLFSDGMGRLLMPGEERNCSRNHPAEREQGFALCLCNNGDVSSGPDFHQGGKVTGRGQ